MSLCQNEWNTSVCFFIQYDATCPSTNKPTLDEIPYPSTNAYGHTCMSLHEYVYNHEQCPCSQHAHFPQKNINLILRIVRVYISIWKKRSRKQLSTEHTVSCYTQNLQATHNAHLKVRKCEHKQTDSRKCQDQLAQSRTLILLCACNQKGVRHDQGVSQANAKLRDGGTGWVRGKRNPRPEPKVQTWLCTVHPSTDHLTPTQQNAEARDAHLSHPSRIQKPQPTSNQLQKSKWHPDRCSTDVLDQPSMGAVALRAVHWRAVWPKTRPAGGVHGRFRVRVRVAFRRGDLPEVIHGRVRMCVCMWLLSKMMCSIFVVCREGDG